MLPVCVSVQMLGWGRRPQHKDKAFLDNSNSHSHDKPC